MRLSQDMLEDTTIVRRLVYCNTHAEGIVVERVSEVALSVDVWDYRTPFGEDDDLLRKLQGRQVGRQAVGERRSHQQHAYQA